MNDPVAIEALRGFPVVVKLPILWGDLDAYGHVNHLVYLKWFETARALYADRVGVETTPGATGVGAVLASIYYKFFRPMSFPGDVYSGVRVVRLSLGAIYLESRIVEAATGVAVAEGGCEAVLWNSGTNQPAAIPDPIRAAVETLERKEFPPSARPAAGRR